MLIRRSWDLEDADRLALLAATAPVDLATKSWELLMSTTPFDQINVNTQRIAPAIFNNLRKAVNVTERERLRGSFKHAWSKNTGMLYGLRDVFRALESTAVEYRVIKGAAVQAVIGQFGARSMGDVDLLVRERDVAKVERIFYDCGFRRNSDRWCSGHADDGHFAALNFNKGSTHADVHVAEVKQPTSVFEAMLSGPCVRLGVSGLSFNVPSIESLLLHAAYHGSIAANPTDLIQAALDVSLLRGPTNSASLNTLATRTRMAVEVRKLDRQLAKINLSGSGLRIPWQHLLATSVLRALSSSLRGLMGVHPVVRRMRTRYPGRHVLSMVRRTFPGHRIAYQLWLALGKFSSTEKLAVRRWGGFLAIPRVAVNGKVAIKPFSGDSQTIAYSTVAAEALDWRFRLAIPEGVRAVNLEFQSDSLDRLDPLVYVNGVPARRLVAQDEESRHLRVLNPNASLEVSIRPLGTACVRCFTGLDDLGVMLNLEI